MHVVSSLLAGLLFGLGLIISGMADPSKVLGFLDLAGAWDPSLIFVMIGAIAVAGPARSCVTSACAASASASWRFRVRSRGS